MRSLRARVFASVIGLTAFGGIAAAADFEAPTVHDWTGFYIGLHAGYGDASYDGDFDISEAEAGFPEETTSADDIDANGFVGGAQLGYNFQSDMLVYGIEADATLTDLDGDAADFGGNDIIEADTDLLASLRARLGIAFDTILIYGTGGVALGTGDFKVIDEHGDNDENSGSKSYSDIGFVVGGGLAWALSESFSLRGEGLYYGFNSDHDTSNLTEDSDPGDELGLDNVFVIRGGVDLHL